jgi:uncharacterized protein
MRSSGRSFADAHKQHDRLGNAGRASTHAQRKSAMFRLDPCRSNPAGRTRKLFFKERSLAEEPLPYFRYHPDPVATGMLVAREDFECPVCHRGRAYAYVGPYTSNTYGFENGEEICPWCIADGSAARSLNATFTTVRFLSAQAQAQMSPEARAELELRTPSFLCLQQEVWLDHHGEAATYIGAVDFDRYLGLPPAAQSVVRNCAGDNPRAALRLTDTVQRLRADGDGPLVYLFRCLHCDWYGAFYAADLSGDPDAWKRKAATLPHRIVEWLASKFR